MPEPTQVRRLEAEVLPGLEAFAADELRHYGSDVSQISTYPGRVTFAYTGNFRGLDTLRTVTAVYGVLQFLVPRPKALLGHQVFSEISAAIREIVSGRPEFKSVSLDAAGADSTVMTRVKRELAESAGLATSLDKGDLHLRVRRTHNTDGWEVLVRLTPRPLVTRSWRTHNFQGALNGAVASVMSSLTRPNVHDSFLNLCCGSGSMMIERAALAASGIILGVDIDSRVLSLAVDHLAAAGVHEAQLVCGDATELPFARGSIDAIVADLPFGQLVGSHSENRRLYPAIITEAARVARRAAVFALITHEKRLIGEVIRNQSAWTTMQRIPINLNGLHPEILVLRRE